MERKLIKTIEKDNRYAKKYLEINNSTEPIKVFLNYFIENLKGTKILNIDYGYGRDAKYFSELGYRVVGID